MYYICTKSEIGCTLDEKQMEMQTLNKKADATREKDIYRVTVVGSVVNFLLLVFKFFAGIVGHSAAMLADAVHSLSDFITDIIVIVFVRISAKPEDEGHDYGHGKYETLATAIIGVFLLFVGFGIFWNGASSIYRFLQGGSLQEPGMLALVAALVSLVICIRHSEQPGQVEEGKSPHHQRFAEARIHKQLMDILEPHGVSIDTVFALAGAVIAAGYGHFVLIEREGAVAVIEPQRHLGKALRPAHAGAAEYHILHLRAAQAFGGLLAEHPAHRVGNVALSAAIGADNAGDPLVKGEHRFIREGLKALHFK